MSLSTKKSSIVIGTALSLILCFRCLLDKSPSTDEGMSRNTFYQPLTSVSRKEVKKEEIQ